MIGPTEVQMDDLIDMIRERIGDTELPVTVGMEDFGGTVFATAKGVTVRTSVDDYVFWTSLFVSLTNSLVSTIETKGCSHA